MRICKSCMLCSCRTAGAANPCAASLNEAMSSKTWAAVIGTRCTPSCMLRGHGIRASGQGEFAGLVLLRPPCSVAVRAARRSLFCQLPVSRPVWGRLELVRGHEVQQGVGRPIGERRPGGSPPQGACLRQHLPGRAPVPCRADGSAHLDGCAGRCRSFRGVQALRLPRCADPAMLHTPDNSARQVRPGQELVPSGRRPQPANPSRQASRCVHRHRCADEGGRSVCMRSARHCCRQGKHCEQQGRQQACGGAPAM